MWRVHIIFDRYQLHSVVISIPSEIIVIPTSLLLTRKHILHHSFPKPSSCFQMPWEKSSCFQMPWKTIMLQCLWATPTSWLEEIKHFCASNAAHHSPAHFLKGALCGSKMVIRHIDKEITIYPSDQSVVFIMFLSIITSYFSPMHTFFFFFWVASLIFC